MAEQLRNNPSNRVEAFQNTKLFSDESASTLPSLLRDDTITLKGGDDNTVPKIVHLPLIERTKKYIMQCISGHPLSLQFSSVVLDYIKDEVINQLDPIICTTFQTYFAFRFLPQLPVELQNEYKLNGGKVFDESIFSKFPTVHKALAEIMDEIFQLSFGKPLFILTICKIYHYRFNTSTRGNNVSDYDVFNVHAYSFAVVVKYW